LPRPTPGARCRSPQPPEASGTIGRFSTPLNWSTPLFMASIL